MADDPVALLLSCENLSKTFGARSLFEGVGLSIFEGDRIGLIGPNGSGKSTLLKILAGLQTPDLASSGRPGAAGIITARNLRVAYVAQQDAFDAGATALDVVAAALADRLHDEHEREDRARLALAKLSITDPAQRADAMSGGWRKRLAIVRALVREPDLLLIDEPTNHLDVPGIQWLEDTLRSLRCAAVVVTHDRYFLERAVTRVMELSRAYPSGVLAVDGVYSTFLQRRAEFLAAQAQQQQSLASKVREDVKWLSRGAQARRTKSQSRIDASQQRMEDLATLKTRNAAATSGAAADIDFTATGRQTRNLLVATGLTKSLGDRTLFRKLDLVLAPGTCVGLLGPNGSGKTTLIRILTGQLQPDEGTIKTANGLRTVVFTQAREELDPTHSLREAITATSGGGEFLYFRGQQLHVNTWASRFLFRPEQLKVSVGDLSGGEQARILMARLMLKPADLLILDEPTNDLDIASLDVLEQSLLDFPGAILLVTHDRFMLDRLATSILALDGDGGVRPFVDLAQWQAAQAEAVKAARRTKPTTRDDAPPAAAPPRKAKLSYKEQRELDQMEATITAAEAQVQRLEALVVDPAVVADHVKLQRACHELGEAHARVASLYERWSQLESRCS